ncbi:MAG: hypothetical protein LBJ00_09975 [Planctomycetaceae bacterium]|jgi:hypothetical protein|nr:hypothetical protein [Planctomycetaceae bacterium]
MIHSSRLKFPKTEYVIATSSCGHSRLKSIIFTGFIIFLVYVFCGSVLWSAGKVFVSERDQLILNIIKRHDDEIDPSNGFPWGSHNSPKGYHSNFDKGTRVHPTRAAMDRAMLLLASPKREHHVEGNKVLERVLELQDCDPNSKTFGIWSWYAEESLSEMATVDYNWADFQGAVLVIILHDFAHRLEADVRARAERSLEYCCRAIIKRNVGAAYTNIAITGATVTAAAGEILGNEKFLEFGRLRILRSLNHFRDSGAFNEYNSPAYSPVVIEELERMLYVVSDIECRNAAKELLSGAWSMLAIRYHPMTGELAGPHSRSYADRLSVKVRSMILARLGDWGNDYKLTQSAAELSVLVPKRQIDERLRKYFLEIPSKPREVKNLFIKSRPAFNVIGTTWMDTTSTIGTASYHTFWEQSRGLIAYWTIDEDNKNNDNITSNKRNNNLSAKKSTNKTVAVFRLRFKRNGNDFASAWGRHYQKDNKILSALGLLVDQGSMHPSMDRSVGGVFRAESFEVEYHLDGFGSRVKRLSEFCYEFSAGSVRVIVHTTPESKFDGEPIHWRTSSNVTSATLTGVCYSGVEREFVFSQLRDTRIILGLELLQDTLKKYEPNAKINSNNFKIIETNFKTTRDGSFYGIIWQNLNDKTPLLAPIKPTQK